MRIADTKAMEQLRQIVRDFDVLIIDNSSDAYDANENERRSVRRFMRQLKGLIEPRSGAVMLISHANKEGAKSRLSESYSGSTAWHNSSRSRLSLVGNDGTVTLTHEKSNYGQLHPPIHFRHEEGGLLIPIDLTEMNSRANSQAISDDQQVFSVISESFKEHNPISSASRGPNNGVGRIKALLTNRLNNRRIDAALKRLEHSAFIGIYSITDSQYKSKSFWKPLVPQVPPIHADIAELQSDLGTPSSAGSGLGGMGGINGGES